MPSDLDDIRAAFEHQIALYGSVLLPDDSAPSPVADLAESEAVMPPVAVPAPIEPVVGPVEPEAVAPPVASPAPMTLQTDVYSRIHALIPADSPLRGMTSLEEVAHFVAQTKLIELDQSRLNPVFGVGDPEADLMVIGDAPDVEEDKKGEPFVGPAGQLLTQILDAIGFNREQVYITDLLKSRVPDNRKPTAEEIRAHIPILHKQITLIRPKLILCLGKTSGTSLLRLDTTLGDMRDTFHDYYGLPVMVTYHPAALLRNSKWKRPTWEDVQNLRKKYDQLTAS